MFGRRYTCQLSANDTQVIENDAPVIGLYSTPANARVQILLNFLDSCSHFREDIFHRNDRKGRFPSFRRKPESRNNKHFWTPASAGVTALMTFYEAIKVSSLLLGCGGDDAFLICRGGFFFLNKDNDGVPSRFLRLIQSPVCCIN